MTAADALDPSRLRSILLPGLVVALGMYPLLAPWVGGVGSIFPLGPSTLLIAETVLFGLAISSAATTIYHTYEGFRFRWLTYVAALRNRSKVRRLSGELKRLYHGRTSNELSSEELDKAAKLTQYLQDFPVVKENGTESYVAERPTRLGNVIAAYELYPETRYCIDGVHYWHHLLHLAPSDCRKHFQESLAFAESLVLTSAAGVVVAVLGACLLLGYLVGHLDSSLIVVTTPTGISFAWASLLLGVLVFGSFYRFATDAHRDAGSSFRSLVDLVMPDFKKWLSQVEAPLSRDLVKRADDVEQYLDHLERPSI